MELNLEKMQTEIVDVKDIEFVSDDDEIIFELKTEHHSISNKEALKDKIHEIHNYLRNNGAGYGMNALKVFNIIYGLKKIEYLKKV